MKNIVTKNCYLGKNSLIFISIFISLFLFVSTNANAYKNGSKGLSGSNSQGCYCHSVNSNSDLALSINGPNIITEGKVYKFTITLNQKKKLDLAAINISFRKSIDGEIDSGLTKFDYHLKQIEGELIHKAFPYEKYFSDSIQTFSFQLKAPNKLGKYYIQAIGMAANADCMNNEVDIWNWMKPFEVEVVPLPRSLSLTHPIGGEILYSGMLHSIKWNYQNLCCVKIALSNDNGNTYTIPIGESNNYNGNYYWNIPDNLEGDNFKIRITSKEFPSIYTESANPFSIQRKAEIVKSNMKNYHICDGEKLTLYFKGSGKGSIYNWKWNGINMNVFADSITVTKPGLYTCQIISKYGPTLTASAQINFLNSEELIIAQPKDTIIFESLYCRLSVETPIENEKEFNLTYKWYKEGSSEVLSTSKNFGFWAYQNNSGNYYCEITTKCGTQRSRSAKVYVIPKTKITNQTNIWNKLCLGKKIELLVKASGINLKYQWYKNNKPLSKGDSSNYIFTPTSNLESGTYFCKVFNNYKDTVQSNNIDINFYSDPVIIEISKVQEVFIEDTAKFDVVLNKNDNDLTYQWYKNNEILNGKTNNSLRIIVNDKSDAGAYHCIIKTQCGIELKTDVMQLIIKDNPQYALMRVKKNLLNLDSFFVNDNSKIKTIDKVIKNIGLSDLIISNIKISGEDASAFSLTSPKNLIVKSGEYADLSFRFLPNKKGLNKAKIEFISNSPENPSVDINCFLIDINIFLEKDSVYFGLMSEAKAVLINKSNIGLSILSYKFSGRDSLSFQLYNYPRYLESNSKGDIIIYMIKSMMDYHKANLSIVVQYLEKPMIIRLGAGIVWSAVDENNEQVKLKVFPNPTNNKINFVLDKTYNKIKYTIFDNSGKIRYRNELNNTNEINWNGYDLNNHECESGAYQIAIDYDDKTEKAKFIIQK